MLFPPKLRIISGLFKLNAVNKVGKRYLVDCDIVNIDANVPSCVSHCIRAHRPGSEIKRITVNCINVNL